VDKTLYTEGNTTNPYAAIVLGSWDYLILLRFPPY